MYSIDNKNYYSSFTEAKLDLLSKLAQAKADHNISTETKEVLSKWSNVVQQSLDNHSQDLTLITAPYSQLSQTALKEINHHISSDDMTILESSPYGNLSVKNMGNSILIRATESAPATELLTNPTPAMMTNVKGVSDKLISLCENYISNNYDYNAVAKAYSQPSITNNQNYEERFKNFACQLLHHVPDTNHAGGFTVEETNEMLTKKGIPNITEKTDISSISREQAEAIINMNLDVLKQNQDLERIMYIHYTFGFSTMRHLPLFGMAENEPTGQLKNIVDNKFGGHQNYLNTLRSPNQDGLNARKFISDDHIYKSDYFSCDPSKGRKGPIDQSTSTTYYGQFTEEQVKLLQQENSPLLVASKGHPSWCPDAVGQKPDNKSKTVKAYMQNETGYLSGPSGTFSLQIALHEMMVNSKNIQDKQLYMQSIYAYIVGTGLHSTHEVLGPAQYTMGLIPGYVAEKPSIDGQMAPPNFDAFFQMAKNNDPDFKERLDKAQRQLVEFYQSIYKNQPEIHSSEELLGELIDNYQSSEHNKYAPSIELLLQNNVHRAGTHSENPLMLAIWQGNEDLIDLIAKQEVFMKTGNNQDIYAMYKGVQSIQAQNNSPFFEFTFKPEEGAFCLEAKWDDVADDNYDLSQHTKEINDFFSNIGINNIAAEDMTKGFMSVDFTDQQQQLLKEHFSQKLASQSKTSADISSTSHNQASEQSQPLPAGADISHQQKKGPLLLSGGLGLSRGSASKTDNTAILKNSSDQKDMPATPSKPKF